MRVKFRRDRDWTPPEDHRITVAYKQGWEGTIKRSWGQAMQAAGDLEEIDPPAAEPTAVEIGARPRGSRRG